MRTLCILAAVTVTAALTGAGHARPKPACQDLLASAEAPVIPITDGWRRSLVDYATENVKHSAWGFAHSQRNYLNSTRLARAEGLAVDDDVLFAAAFLHDLGGLEGFAVEGVDHAVRSAELAPDILLPRGFPAEKLAHVQEVIKSHTYYNPDLPQSTEGKVFRDADVLDFLGAMGVARITSITGREDFAPDLAAAVRLTRSLHQNLPAKLLTPTGQCNGERRAALLGQILESLNLESFGGFAF